MKILCTIILFQPNWENLESLLEDMSKYIDNFFLWDNTPGGCGKDNFLGYIISRRENVGGGNVGLSQAYNEAWIYASKHGYDYLMTMDHLCQLPLHPQQHHQLQRLVDWWHSVN